MQVTLDLSAPDLAERLRALDYAAVVKLREAMPVCVSAWSEYPGQTWRPWRRFVGTSDIGRVERYLHGWIGKVHHEYLTDPDLLIFPTALDAMRAVDAELIKQGLVLEDPVL